MKRTAATIFAFSFVTLFAAYLGAGKSSIESSESDTVPATAFSEPPEEQPTFSSQSPFTLRSFLKEKTFSLWKRINDSPYIYLDGSTTNKHTAFIILCGFLVSAPLVFGTWFYCAIYS